MFLFLIIFVTTSACAIIRVVPKTKGIDSTFEPYIEDYKHLIGGGYEKRFENLHINFAKLEGEVVGRCYWLLAGGFEVEIDTDFWLNTLNPQKKAFVVYHELEHCIRLRMHTDKKPEMENIVDFIEEIGYKLGIIKKYGELRDGCPSSLMNSMVINGWCRIKHYNHYLEEIRTYSD